MSDSEFANRIEQPEPLAEEGDMLSGERTPTLTWMKRGLAVAALAGIAYGGYEAATHFSEVESAVKEHDQWAAPALLVTEGLAWGTTPIMLGAAAKQLGSKKFKFSEVPDKMRDLENNRTFKWSMNGNMLGAAGTTSVLIVGAEALPEAARPLVYGVAAGSLALSSIPIKAAYVIDKRNRQKKAGA